MFTQYEYHTLPYKYYPLLPPHTESEMFLIVCELIDNLWRSLGGDRDDVDSTISDRLNIVIVCVNKESKAMHNEPPPKAEHRIGPTLMPHLVTELVQYVFLELTNYLQFEQFKSNLL